MSYRTWVNDFQFLDNNGYSQELIDELKRQGMKEPDDDCCYSFKVKDINPIIAIVDKYVEKEVAKREDKGFKMYDLTDIPDCYSCMPLHLKMEHITKDKWVFMSYCFVDYLLRTGCIKRVDDTYKTPVYEIKKTIRIYAG